MRFSDPRGVAVALLLTLTAACHRPVANSAPARVAFSADARGPDVGLAMLANVENARLALAADDRLAANNDIDRALDDAEQLAGQSSALFPDEVPTAGSGRGNAARSGGPPTGLVRFAAQVRLQSAAAELESGAPAKADADLGSIQAGVPARAVPPTLPLVRAQQSLALIRTAPAGRPQASQLAQLRAAETALQSYAGPSHQADTKALAAEIARSLAAGGDAANLAPGRVSVWADEIDAWIGPYGSTRASA